MSSVTQLPDHWALEFLQLNDMALGFRDRLEKAEAENAKLREVLQDAYDDYCLMYTYVDGAYCFEDLHEDPLFGPTVRLLEEALGVDA